MRKLPRCHKSLVACRFCHMGILACLIILLSLFTGGCWDLRELQERNFVLAMAIDLADEDSQDGQEGKKAQVETYVQAAGEKKYRLSFQILKLTSPQGNRQGVEPAKTFVLSNTGASIFDMIRDTLGQSSKSLYFEHMQTVVLSEAVVRQAGLRPVFDLLRRDHEMRWRMKVFVTPGQARPLLEYNPPTSEPGGIFLANIVENHRRSFHIAGARTDLGNISQALDSEQDIFIPRIELADKVVKVGGVAVVKDGKFLSYLDEYITRGIKYVLGTAKSGSISFECPEHPGNIWVFEMYDHRTKLEPHVFHEQIHFTLDITMHGTLAEAMCTDCHEKTSGSTTQLRKVEENVAKQVKKNILDAKKVLQDMGVDGFEFKTKLKGHNPEAWAKVKDRWEEVYPTIPMTVSVNVIIRGIGEHE